MSLHYHKLLLLFTEDDSINGYNDYFKKCANHTNLILHIQYLDAPALQSCKHAMNVTNFSDL